MAGIGGDRAQLRLRIDGARICSGKRRSKALIAVRVMSVPRFHLGCRPARVAIGVTVVASVWRAEFYRQIGPREAQAVIVPRVDNHIGRGWHVAGHTRGAGAGGLVVVGRPRIVLTWQVSRSAEARAFRTPLSLLPTHARAS